MAKLKRTLSLRKRRSYKSLDVDADLQKNDFFSTPKAKLTPVKEIAGIPGSYTRRRSSDMQVAASVNVNVSNKENITSLDQSTSKFLRMTAVKNVLSNISDKLKGGGKIKRKMLRESPYRVNPAYTPRRSERLAMKSLTPITTDEKSNTPTLSMKMYSPFCIETPGSRIDMEASFTYIGFRKSAPRATEPVIESPLPSSPESNPTPRRQVKRALKQHKKLANNLSASSLKSTGSGY